MQAVCEMRTKKPPALTRLWRFARRLWYAEHWERIDDRLARSERLNQTVQEFQRVRKHADDA